MIRETIQDVVANITETCMNEDVYVTDEESIHLPNRGTIIGIIKDLRRVVFPGYFGDEMCIRDRCVSFHTALYCQLL